MESHHDEMLASPSKVSFVGSYYQPPDRIVSIPKQPQLHAYSSIGLDPYIRSPQGSQTKNIDSRAVVDALKTLQQKIRRLELERKQAEKTFQQFSRDAQNPQQVIESCIVHGQPASSQADAAHIFDKKEMESDLQSAETRCKLLEKQLDYMRKLAENAKKERDVLIKSQNQQPSSSNIQSHREKLEKLETDCLKLSRTQALAELKIGILEENLLKEVHERQLVQQKAEQLQKELDTNLILSRPTAAADKTLKKKTKKTSKKCSRPKELGSPCGLRHKKMPFVVGMSTSPSHSVHANVQSILHMMKHHQPQLCERVSALHRSGHGIKKNLQVEFALCSPTSHKPDRKLEQAEPCLGSLSDLLLALQDELGQMSFEHQELVGQIGAIEYHEEREDLQKELERLVARMEEKGAQITKLRKHQQTVHKLKQGQPCSEEHTATKLNGVVPPAPSPVKVKDKGKKGGAIDSNLQLLRETQKLRNSLKQDDLCWEA